MAFLSRNGRTEFEYGSSEDFEYLRALFLAVNRSTLREDLALYETDASEQTICGAFKSHFDYFIKKQGLRGYHVDVEYNRNCGDVKTILDDRERVIRIRCDLILHSRGEIPAQDNLLALEMKKSTRPQSEKDADRMRLAALTKAAYGDVWCFDGKTLPEHVCRYLLGVFYEIDARRRVVGLEFYRGGVLTEKKEVPWEGRSPYKARSELHTAKRED